MILGDIKVEALRLMFVNLDSDIYWRDMPRLLGDETYSSYLVNMNGSINRALDIFERYGTIKNTVERLPVKNEMTDDTKALDIPDDLARILPYFIKSELYAEDEPSEAMNARHLFINFLEDIAAKNTPQIVVNYKGY